MTTIIIDDSNIKLYVDYYYLSNKSQLPPLLKNTPIGDWGQYFSNITNMSNLFKNARNFNEPLNNWGPYLGSVTTMEGMFFRCKSFNQPLDNWNVSNVTTMEGMFQLCDTFNQPLDNWNVSSVTNMTEMFNYCNKFNQPLNAWNVSSVTTMEGMFKGCNFNQPLDNWDVSNITNMHEMFSYCRTFNQNLSGWNISHNTDVTDMFIGSLMTETNKPSRTRRRPQIRVDAMQVHRTSAKVNVTGLISFFAEKIPDIETQMPSSVGSPSPFATYIKTTIQTIIDALPETPEKKTELTTKLTSIYENRLNRVDLSQFSRDTLKLAFYSLEYVKTQNDAFKDLYVNSYLQDCVSAYEAEGTAGMSCVGGVIERIYLSLTDACAEDRETNPEHNTIINLLENVKSINDRIMDWYKLHKIGTPGAFPEGKTLEEKKSDLRTYLLPFFPGKETEINQAIETMSSAIGFDNEDFTYGGKKRKTKKRIKNKRSKTRKNKRGKTKKNKPPKKNK